MTNDTYSIAASARFLGLDVTQVMRLVENGQLACTQANDGEPFVAGRDLTRYAVASFGKPR